MRSTSEILDHHFRAFDEGDIDGLLSDYDDQALFFSQDGLLRGPSEIRPFFERILAELGKPNVSFEMDQVTVEDDTAYIVWHAETEDRAYELATDTFVMRDDKILRQTFAALIRPKK